LENNTKNCNRGKRFARKLIGCNFFNRTNQDFTPQQKQTGGNSRCVSCNFFIIVIQKYNSLVQIFTLTVFNRSRVYRGLIVLPFAFPALLILGIKLQNILLGFLLGVAYIFLMLYNAYGQLTIEFNNGLLLFSWKKKLVFNHKPIDPIIIKDILALVIEKEICLRKIKTVLRTIPINNKKSTSATAFIQKLSEDTREYNTRIIDTWDELAENGHLKIVYWITTILLIILLGMVLFFIFKKGFNIKLLIALFVILQIESYRRIIQRRLKRRKNYS